jgi:predicted 3-demethylubiquinone-9 3-methyltransferase (glyoxalase superfamily)
MCGWLKDKYGLSWQVCPHNWAEIMSKPGALQKMMGMKKFVLAEF